MYKIPVIEEKLSEKLEDKEVKPELMLKTAIFLAIKHCLDLQTDMSYSNFRNGGILNKPLLEKYKLSIINLFGYIQFMVNERQMYFYKEDHETNYYELIEDIELGIKKPPLKVIIMCKRYVFYCLHKMKFTDLLLNSDMDLEKAIEAQW